MDQDVQKVSRYGAYAVIIQDEKLLLTYKESGPYKGLWDLPGGGIEFGESPEMTLKREVEEETALEVSQIKLLTVLTYQNTYSKNGKEYHFHHVGIIYQAHHLKPLQERVAQDKMKWIHISEVVLDELTPFAKECWNINSL